VEKLRPSNVQGILRITILHGDERGKSSRNLKQGKQNEKKILSLERTKKNVAFGGAPQHLRAEQNSREGGNNELVHAQRQGGKRSGTKDSANGKRLGT